MPEVEETVGPVHAATRGKIVFGVTVGTIAVTTALFGTACPAYGCPDPGCGRIYDGGSDTGSAVDSGSDTGSAVDSGGTGSDTGP